MTPTSHTSAVAHRRIPRPAVPPPKPIALVIDFDDDMRNILGILLASAGYEVVRATDVDDAKRLATLHPPTLVFTDIRDGLGGRVVLPARLRESPAIARAAVVVTSSWPMDGDDALALSSGACLFMPMPLDFTFFRRYAAHVLQHR